MKNHTKQLMYDGDISLPDGLIIIMDTKTIDEII